MERSLLILILDILIHIQMAYSKLKYEMRALIGEFGSKLLVKSIFLKTETLNFNMKGQCTIFITRKPNRLKLLS